MPSKKKPLRPARHTARPWTYRQSDGVVFSGKVPVCMVLANPDTEAGEPLGAQQIAFNASLIMSAPDLLAVCRAVENGGRTLTKEVRAMLRDAIETATGGDL